MTWVRCDCCGEEGEDDVAQYVIEEACWERYRGVVQKEISGDESMPDVSPGQSASAEHMARMAQLRGEL